MEQKDKAGINRPVYQKIEPDSSDKVYWREIQKTVEYYGTLLYTLSTETTRLSVKQEEILFLLRDLKEKVEEIERRKPCSGKIQKNAWSKDPTYPLRLEADDKKLHEAAIRFLKGKGHE